MLLVTGVALPGGVHPQREEAAANARLIAAAPTFHAACQGADPDVTALEWLSALFTELDSDSGVLGAAIKQSTDPNALYHAWGESCRLLRNLKAAMAQATGQEAASND